MERQEVELETQKPPGCSGDSEHGQGANRETSRVLATFQEVADLAWVLKGGSLLPSLSEVH